MRILYLSHRMNAADGSAVHGREFARAVSALGCTVQVLTEAEPGHRSWLWSRLKRRARRIGASTVVLVELVEGAVVTLRTVLMRWREVKRFSPDALVFRLSPFDFAPLVLARMTRAPAVAEVNCVKPLERGLDPATGAGRLLSAAEGWVVRRADRVYAVSEELKQLVETHYTPRHPPTVIENGVDAERFDPSQYDRARAKERLGLGGKRVLGYVGSYQRWHGLERLVQIAEELNREGDTFRLLLIGDGVERKRVTGLIERKRMQHAVTQVGRVAHREMPAYLAAMDYAPMPYATEAPFYFSPLKLFEYLAMGVIVLAPQLGQLGRIIRGGETGWIIADGSVDDYVQAIGRLEAAPALADGIRRRGRERVVDGHSWLENARKVVRLCDEAVQPRRGMAVKRE